MNNIKNKISLLDYAILVVILIFFSIVYFYSSIIWPREEKFKAIDRSRMVRIDNAQKLYNSLTNDYQNEPALLFALIEAVKDTLDGDEFFEGSKKVILANKIVEYSLAENINGILKLDTVLVDDSESKSFEFSEGLKLYASKIFSDLNRPNNISEDQIISHLIADHVSFFTSKNPKDSRNLINENGESYFRYSMNEKKEFVESNITPLDTLYKDFVSDKIINKDDIEKYTFQVDIPPGFKTRLDTTFTKPIRVEETYEEKIFAVKIKNFDPSDSFIDIGNGVWDDAEPFFDENQNGVWDDSEKFIENNGVYDLGEDFIDSNNNNKWDPADNFEDEKNGIYDIGESFVDTKNGIYDLGEKFEDKGNNEWDPGESFIDEPNGRYDLGEDFTDSNDNGVYDFAESYVDVNNNNSWDFFEPYNDSNNNKKWDQAEEYSDLPNGKYDIGEKFDDIGNGVWDPAESFTDSNSNGKWDLGENYIDVNGNGKYDQAENFKDVSNGIYDKGEPFTDGNGKWDFGEKLTDDWNNNGVWDPAESFTDSNGEYNKGESFVDCQIIGEKKICNDSWWRKFIGNGEWDSAENFTDLNNNGKWDSAEEFIDTNQNGKWDDNEQLIDKGNGIYDDGEIYYDINYFNEDTHNEYKSKDLIYLGYLPNQDTLYTIVDPISGSELKIPKYELKRKYKNHDIKKVESIDYKLVERKRVFMDYLSKSDTLSRDSLYSSINFFKRNYNENDMFDITISRFEDEFYFINLIKHGFSSNFVYPENFSQMDGVEFSDLSVKIPMIDQSVDAAICFSRIDNPNITISSPVIANQYWPYWHKLHSVNIKNVKDYNYSRSSFQIPTPFSFYSGQPGEIINHVKSWAN